MSDETLTQLPLNDDVHVNNQLMLAMLLDKRRGGDECRFVIGPNWNYLMLFDTSLTIIHTEDVADKSIERFGNHITVEFTQSTKGSCIEFPLKSL